MEINTRKNDRRAKDFFVRNLNVEQKGRMSEVCKTAHTIYELSREGLPSLSDYLVNEIMIPKDKAEMIVAKYDPAHPPVDICPVATVEGGNWEKIFSMLSLEIDGIWPKNLLGWYIMKYAFDEEFDFELIGSGANGHDNKILFPNLVLGPDGNPLPFGLAAINAIKVGKLPAHIVRKANHIMKKFGPIGEDFVKSFVEAGIIFPPNAVLDRLIEVIQRGLCGEEIILTGAFCPDYAYIPKPGFPGQYQYTFENVGDGVGLVAKQFARVLPILAKFFDQYKIKYQIKLGIGDFEGNSQEILERVALDHEEFIARCEKSLEAFRSHVGVPVELVLFEKHWANGRWKKYCDEAREKMFSGDFGKIKEYTGKSPNQEIIPFIAKDGATFYRRWYQRPEMTLKEIEQLVISQGAEYAAMGRVLQEDFGDKPFIQIAGDRPKMQAFNAFWSNHPTVCTERVY